MNPPPPPRSTGQQEPSNISDDLDMMKQLFEALKSTKNDDIDGCVSTDLIDGIIEQFMSKELMYEPMKQVTNKFPQWLEKHREDLSSKEYADRQEQYACFQCIVKLYEAKGEKAESANNKKETTQQLIHWMQKVQEFGQPPAEIIQEIAPGLELDEEGVPKFDFFGSDA